MVIFRTSDVILKETDYMQLRLGSDMGHRAGNSRHRRLLPGQSGLLKVGGNKAL
jgi:hypothetical protein